MTAARTGAAAALAGTLAAGLLLAAGGAAAQAYKWVDAQGKTHFSDTPPPDRKAARVSIKTQIAEDPAAAAQQRDWKTQLQESGTRQQNERNKLAAAEHRRRTAESRCLAARSNLDLLARERPIFRLDKDGQREYLEDRDRPALLQRAQERVESDCR
jgi:hypothetical protein